MVGAPLVDLFHIRNDGAMRQEIEIQVDRKDGRSFFSATIILQEAKFIMYSDCLGFLDCSNLDGFGFRGGPVVTIRLKKAINID